ncbi:hypothetical protein F4804DRAFT_335922 [Jackrogersella minutella]|nr:hypothetical protein F4804DRAFT_335922 [Jackrogersella minutella]
MGSGEVYQRLVADLKFEVWERASMVPGVHHFKLVADLMGDIMHSMTPRHTQSLKLFPIANSAPEDPSAWRERRKLRKVDKWSRLIWLQLEQGPSAKEFWTRGSKQIPSSFEQCPIVNCDYDLVTFRVVGYPLGTWIRRLANPEAFTGLKRIAVDFDHPREDYSRRKFVFECGCYDRKHMFDRYCPISLDHFFSYFPQLEKFYFIVKLIPKAVTPAAHIELPQESRKESRKRDRKCKMKEAPRMTRAQAGKRHVEGIIAKFRQVAQREELDDFEDLNGHYYEVRESDTQEFLLSHAEIWSQIRALKKFWREQKTIPDLGRTIHEVELGVLVCL